LSIVCVFIFISEFYCMLAWKKIEVNKVSRMKEPVRVWLGSYPVIIR